MPSFEAHPCFKNLIIMESENLHIPAGPEKEHTSADDLLDWMGRQFEIYGDTYKATVYGTPAYVTRDPDFAHQVLVANPQNFAKGTGTIGRVAILLGNGLMTSEGELWKRQRRMIQPAFNHPFVTPFTSLMKAANLKLLENWKAAAQNGKTVNLTRDISAMILEVVLRFIFGEDYEEIRIPFDLLTQDQARNMAFARSFRALGSVVLEVMKGRRTKAPASEDALGLIMQARDPQTGRSMDDRQLIDEILTIVVAGHETTASTLNWTWYLLSQHPEIDKRMSEEIRQTAFSGFEDLTKFPYTRQIIEESMRLYPPGWVVSRRTLHDDRSGDYMIPAGTEVYVSIYHIHRNPKLWKDPDCFDPDHFRAGSQKNRHALAAIPFSAGPRNCIGGFLARTEMQIHLVAVARDLRFEYVESQPIEIEAGVNLRSKHDFLMVPRTR